MVFGYFIEDLTIFYQFCVFYCTSNPPYFHNHTIFETFSVSWKFLYSDRIPARMRKFRSCNVQNKGETLTLNWWKNNSRVKGLSLENSPRIIFWQSVSKLYVHTVLIRASPASLCMLCRESKERQRMLDVV